MDRTSARPQPAATTTATTATDTTMTTTQAHPTSRGDEGFKKTNSLAFSSTPCHTCLANGLSCDRRRPKCRTCLTQGRQCGGFATPLSWDNSRIWLGQSAQPPAPQPQPPPPPPPPQPPPQLQPLQQHATAGAQADKTQSSRGQDRDAVSLESNHHQQRSKPKQGGFRFVSSISRPRKRRKTAPQTARKRAHTIGDAEQAASHAASEESSGRICDIGSEPSTFDPVMGTTMSTTASAHAAQTQTVPPAGTDAAQDIVDDSLSEDPSLLDLGANASWTHQIVPSPPRWDLNMLPPELDRAGFSNPDDNWNICFDLFQGQQGSTLNGLNMGDNLQFSPFTMQQDLASGTMQVTAETSDREYIWFFEKYDSEYCALPITNDAVNNPFRLRIESWASPLLEHVVRALCYQHMERPGEGRWEERILEHREKAISLLKTASSPESPPTDRELSLLDPILLMISLDCTMSALGKWNDHLHRAQVLLDAHGGPPALNTSRLRSQVAMLLWWDVTLALISRCGMILSRDYYEYLVVRESEDEWSFYDLTGCPGSLILHLLELADLAKQNEIAAMAKWLTMDMTPIHEVEAAIKSWQNPFTRNLDDNSPRSGEAESAVDDAPNEESELEEIINNQQDQYHIVESWRFAILVYVQRVFRWDRGSRPPTLLKVYARRALDHVRSCRRTAQTQKQALLPIFLAGSETSHDELREFANSYCEWWTTRSRFKMFNTAATVLKEIWTASADGHTSAWWGSVIDRNSKSSGGKLESQYLFG